MKKKSTKPVKKAPTKSNSFAWLTKYPYLTIAALFLILFTILYHATLYQDKVFDVPDGSRASIGEISG